jgi:hypothetical protein
MKRLTIIITASYIPSHPRSEHIDSVIESLKFLKYPEDTVIILAHDYPPNPSKVDLENYLEYYNKLQTKYSLKDNFKITMLDKYGHLSGNIRNAFNYVDSKYVLFVQHDFPFIKKVNLNSVMEDMDKNKNLKHIRFNKRKTIQTAGDSLTQNCNLNIFNNYSIKGKCSYISTFCWSDNNHISPTSYYTDVVLKEVQNAIFMENHFYQKLRKLSELKDVENNILENAFLKHGNFIYGEINDEPYIFHNDGRKSV